MKKWIIAQIALIVVVAIIGQIFKANFPNSGIADINRYADIQKINPVIENIIGKKDYDSITKYEKEYIEEQKQTKIILIVSATGEISQVDDILAQGAIVEKVIKGEKNMVGNSINIINADGFSVANNEIRYYGGHNLLLPDTRYLVFLENSEWLTGLSAKGYDLVGGYLSYLNIEENNSAVLKNDSGTVNYNDVKSYEFFVDDKKTMLQLNKMKNELIQYFGAKYS